MTFYCYFWLRLDGSPYYVGVGEGRRAYVQGSHRTFRPPSRDRILLHLYPSREEAIVAEKFFISFFGRKDIGTGILRNLTDGGDGGPIWRGRKHKPESRAKISVGLMGHEVSEHTRQAVSRSNKTRVQSEHARDCLRERMKGNKFACNQSIEVRQATSERNKTRVRTEEESKKRSISMKRAYAEGRRTRFGRVVGVKP